ncbi:MAG: SHOCT domain-containing protein [Proteobacteria bacterium]|nr:SHOCT domain-containing protein [Pseudomonadota bacterium]
MTPDKMKNLLVAVVIMLGFTTTSWAQQEGGRSDYWGPHMMWGGGWMGGTFMIIFWILVIVVIYFGIRWAIKSGDSHGFKQAESALDVLKRRYASGEIDREQYLSMKQDVEN